MKISNFDEMIVRLKKEIEQKLTDVVIKSNFDEDNIRKTLSEINTINVYTDSIEVDGVVRIEPNTVEGIVVPFSAQVKFMLSIDSETKEVVKNTAFGLCTIGMKNQPQKMFDVDSLYVSSYDISNFID